MEANKKTGSWCKSRGCNGRKVHDTGLTVGEAYAMSNNTTRCFMFCTHIYAWKREEKQSIRVSMCGECMGVRLVRVGRVYMK